MHAEGERKQAENNQEGAIQTYRTMSPTPAVPLVVAAPKASQPSPPTQFQRPISCFFVGQSPNPLDLNDNDSPYSIFYCLENCSHVHITMYYPSRTSVRRVSQFQPPLRPNFSYRTFSIQGILQSWLHHFDGSLCIATRHSLVQESNSFVRKTHKGLPPLPDKPPEILLCFLKH